MKGSSRAGLQAKATAARGGHAARDEWLPASRYRPQVSEWAVGYPETERKSQEKSSRDLCSRPTDEDEREFRELVEKWRTDMMFVSSTTERIMHSAYQRIIGMGPVAVPLMLRELKEHGGHWFWALEAITGENPPGTENEGNVRRLREGWLKWGEERGMI